MSTKKKPTAKKFPLHLTEKEMHGMANDTNAAPEVRMIHTIASPERIELVMSMPGLEATIRELVAAALAHAAREEDGPNDPRAERCLEQEGQRIAIDQDRQKLAWAEFHLREKEEERRALEDADRRAERREEMERRRVEQEKRQCEEKQREMENAFVRGEVFDVWLMSRGATPIQVIKVVREATNLGLKEAKDLVDMCPSVVRERVLKEHARRIYNALVAAGAGVEMKTAVLTENNVRPLY